MIHFTFSPIIKAMHQQYIRNYERLTM